MDVKRKRQANFSCDEKLKLLDAIKVKRDVVNNKRTDGTSIKNKEAAWKEIAQIFNSRGMIERSVESLKKMWEKLKSEAKVYHAKKRVDITKTGGGPPNQELIEDPVVMLVLQLIRRGGTGVVNVNDCDTEISLTYQDMNETQVSENLQEEFLQQDLSMPLDMQPDIIIIETATDNMGVEEENGRDVVSIPDEQTTSTQETNATPRPKKRSWSARRRPVVTPQNERSWMQMSDFYKKNCTEKSEIEHLRKTLLEREMMRVEELHTLKMKAAELDIEIKQEILNKIRGGNIQDVIKDLL